MCIGGELMKKKLALIISLCSIMMFAFVGCATNDDYNNDVTGTDDTLDDMDDNLDNDVNDVGNDIKNGVNDVTDDIDNGINNNNNTTGTNG
ncbi:MAG: hypothetical protein K0S47_4776, partial [Herbinix sp.]|nr:hypothetical protein [Herbinix sp.]